MTLSPAFASDVTEYTATTSNATNTITATPTDADATVTVLVNGEPHVNGTPTSWDEGENEIKVRCTHDTSSTVYTVVVTKE